MDLLPKFRPKPRTKTKIGAEVIRGPCTQPGGSRSSRRATETENTATHRVTDGSIASFSSSELEPPFEIGGPLPDFGSLITDTSLCLNFFEDLPRS
ncbi:hypothetical protein Nepgr_020563 [Nepenthes gracilis]|uniref:Uncharacterized protein n=1 Tax=Nepenthes gracilis TaxID=150966 RepID=A0AAD3SY94_NEPGR|nr:hypothetical protein Nepgr_020563 [Nepenthes gracilis]